MSGPDQDLSNCGGDDKVGGGFCPESVRQKVCEKLGKVPLFRFRKLVRKNKLPCFSGRKENVGGGCFMCFTKSPSDDSPVTSDPNSPNFTFELMKSMIEKNDFYCKECNTHFDLEGDSKSCEVDSKNDK